MGTLRKVACVCAIVLAGLAISCSSDKDATVPDTAPASEAATPAAAADPTPAAGLGLDGSKFTVKLTAGDKTDDDTLVFDKSHFESLGCRQYGFTPSEYATTPIEGGMEFTSVTKSEAEGTMTWKGTVKGDQLTGSAEWVKEGQAPIKYEFAGAKSE